MARYKGKVAEIDTHRDTFGEHSRSSDVVLRIAKTVNENDLPSATSKAYTDLKRGNVIKISGAPDTLKQNLQNMNGYHFIDEIGFASGGNYNFIYMTTGRALWKADADSIIKGSNYEINTNTNDNNMPNIAGWQKNAATANDFMNQAAGKFANCKRIYEWIKNEVIPDSNYVKERQNIANFENIIADLEDWWWYAQAAYNQCDGLKNTLNPYYADSSQKALIKISDVYKLAAQRMKRAEDDFLKKEKNIKDWAKVTGLEKAWQAAKTILNAPGRGLMQFIIQNNVKGVGSAYYALQQASEKDGAGSQKRKEYDKMANNWYKGGGNKTTFNEMIRIGGGKKEIGFDSSYSSADGTENETVKLPIGLGSIASTAAILVASSNPATLPSVAVWGPEAIAVGGTIDGAIVVINGLNIKKGGKKNDEANTDPTSTTTTIIPPTDPRSTMMFDWEKYKYPIIGSSLLLATSITLYIFRDKIFKK